MRAAATRRSWCANSVALAAALALAAGVASANDDARARASEPGPAKAASAGPGEQEKTLTGMSIVGNDEAPRSLVIVPWKSSDLGAELDVSFGLDAGRGPVDRDVFRRALSYYEIRVEQGASARR